VPEASEIRVLVVDDHTATRSGIKAILDSEIGITVVGEATNIESAVSMADRRKPDVVVMDLQLDGDMGGGFAATRRVLEADPDVGVMMFTAFGEHHLLTDGLEAGARGFMVKDATPAEMVRGVRIVAEGGAYLDPSHSADLLRGRGLGQIPGLSAREREILAMLADGESNREIAAKLYISTETVRTHVRNAMRKLDADTRTQAVALAIRQRLIG
jgi:DNA-binding NarL/FixJ family response regulator